MRCYRISKYDPQKRNLKGFYQAEEWTSISDIGRIFAGDELTLDEYLKTEKNYLCFLRQLVEQLGRKKLWLRGLECYQECSTSWENGQRVDNNDEYLCFAQDCLREQCWGKIIGKSFFVHFGYDYYVYIATNMDFRILHQIANSNDLYIEKIKSPYIEKKDYLLFAFPVLGGLKKDISGHIHSKS